MRSKALMRSAGTDGLGVNVVKCRGSQALHYLASIPTACIAAKDLKALCIKPGLQGLRSPVQVDWEARHSSCDLGHEYGGIRNPTRLFDTQHRPPPTVASVLQTVLG